MALLEWIRILEDVFENEAQWRVRQLSANTSYVTSPELFESLLAIDTAHTVVGACVLLSTKLGYDVLGLKQHVNSFKGGRIGHIHCCRDGRYSEISRTLFKRPLLLT